MPISPPHIPPHTSVPGPPRRAEHGSFDQAPETAVLDPRRRQLILVAMCTALLAVVASVSGLNVAQQQLAESLHASQSSLLWVINGYTVALAALLLAIGAIGDRWGRKYVLMSGLALFAVANVAASLATSVTMLIIFRVAGGISAAMIMPVTLSVITSSFPVEERGRAVGVWSGFAGAGGILGLVSSAILVDNFTWPWLFAAPAVLSLVSLAMTAKFVPHSNEHHHGRFDTVGSILSAVAVGGLVLGIHEGPELGWFATLTVLGIVLGVASTIGFVIWELRQEHPLLDLRVFKDRSLASGSFALVVTFAIIMGMFLVIIQFLQAVLGYSAVRAAVALLPMALVMMPLSAIAPGLSQRFGLRTMLTAGSLSVAAGLALMAGFGSAEGGYWPILPGMLILGLGMGLSMSPGTTAITGSLPEDKQGVASALNDTVREFGGAIGIALIGSVLNAGYTSHVKAATATLSPQVGAAVREGIGGALSSAGQLGADAPRVLLAARDAFVSGWTMAMWISTALALAAAAFVFAWSPRHQPSTDESGELFLDEPALEAVGV